MKRKLFTILLCGIMVLGLAGCSNDNNPNNNNTNEPLQEEKLGNVQKETVNDLIAKYNTEIMDGGLGTPAYDNGMVIENGIYWFALTEEISFYIKPLECSEDKTKDIVETGGMFIEKENFDEETALKYFKALIKANNSDLTAEEIDFLVKEAKELQKDKLMANNGKGLYVAIIEKSNAFEYQVKRIYE